MSEQEILPCPFCGESHTIVSRATGEDVYVMCVNSECDAFGPGLKDEESAIAAWNKVAAVMLAERSKGE